MERSYPGKTVDRGKDIGECNDCHAGGSFDRPGEVCVAIYIRDGVSLAGHHTGDDKVNHHASNGADKKQLATADAIDVWKHDSCRDKEENVLNGGRP